MKKILKFLGWTVLVLLVLVILLVVFVQLTWDKTYDVPLSELKASDDSLSIARGRYLVYGPSHCATCHVPMDKLKEVDAGLEIPLSGGWEETLDGFGTFRAPNLTPDKDTGIGNLSDGQLVRAIRNQIRHDGRIMAPFMTYQGLSDEDIVAILSFLRSQPAVGNQVKPTEWEFVGRALIAFGMVSPEGPKSIVNVKVDSGDALVYGKYLADHVAQCHTCHMLMDNTGKQIGEDYIGGTPFAPNPFSEGMAFVSPNLTPDPETGMIATWTQEEFVSRFKRGRVLAGSPMPWGFFQRMEEEDMKAIYAYLRTVKPIKHEIPKTVYLPGEELPSQ